jgi:hypothetical protein
VPSERKDSQELRGSLRSKRLAQAGKWMGTLGIGVSIGIGVVKSAFRFSADDLITALALAIPLGIIAWFLEDRYLKYQERLADLRLINDELERRHIERFFRENVETLNFTQIIEKFKAGTLTMKDFLKIRPAKSDHQDKSA